MFNKVSPGCSDYDSIFAGHWIYGENNSKMKKLNVSSNPMILINEYV